MASELSGGYDVQFVNNHRELSDKYKCVICWMVPRDVHQITCCGKMICHHCLERHKRTSNNCPACRTRGSNTFSDKSRCQEILSLRVYCYYKEHGCLWSGELRTLVRNHADGCVFKLIECPECKEKVPDKGLGDHLASACVKRMYWCQYCKESGSYEEIQNKHISECPECPIECPNGCKSNKIKRKDIEKHRSVCPEQLIHCCYYQLGCNIMIKNKEKVAHEKACTKKTLSSSSVMSNKREADKDTLPINICIDNFQSRMANKEIWEQDFFTENCGYFMSLKVHLAGCRDTHIACYFYMRAGPHDCSLSWPFRGVFILEMLNQKEDNNHYFKEIKFLTSNLDAYNSQVVGCERACLGIGEPKYVPHSVVSQKTQSCQYLENDKLILRLSIKSVDTSKSSWGHFGGCH